MKRVTMPRRDYDVVFYRVFCATLLALAFIFTVILTNVFVDIDGLLSNKEKEILNKTPEPVKTERPETQTSAVLLNPEEPKTSVFYDEVGNYEDNGDDLGYRTKRSIKPYFAESQNFQVRIKSPKMKNIITNRLTSLLEELDADDSSKTAKREIHKTVTNTLPNNEEKDIKNDNKEHIKKLPQNAQKSKDDEILQLAIHNMLLESLVSRLDLQDLDKKLQSTINDVNRKIPARRSGTLVYVPTEVTTNSPLSTTTEASYQGKNISSESIKSSQQQGKQMLIKTVINITTLNGDRETNNVKGFVKLIYNDRLIEFTQVDKDKNKVANKNVVESTTVKAEIKEVPKIRIKEIVPIDYYAETERNKFRKWYFNKILSRYLKRYRKDLEKCAKRQNRRSKRNVKIHYTDVNNEHKMKPKQQKPVRQSQKKNDDELFVEIETHFNSKGLKNEKKKKIIRNLIQKIQKAIHTEPEPNKKRKHMHIKKRTQNPLKPVELNVHGPDVVEPVPQRQINPLGNFYHIDTFPSNSNTHDNLSENGRNKGPGFLSNTKEINSAEMSEVDVDYTKVMEINGIPQRLQKPLNTDKSNESINGRTFFDLGNLKFMVKDFGSSGFSIGFNQYVDESPDTETLNSFTGMDSLLKTYEPKTLEKGTSNDYSDMDKVYDDEKQHEVVKRDVTIKTNKSQRHIVVRRSTQELDKQDYSNQYLYQNSPFQDYQEIYDNKKEKMTLSMNNIAVNRINKDSNNLKITSKDMTSIKEQPLVIDDYIFSKNLKPAEIFSLANLLDRKKRSLKVKKMSNLNTKIKLNRYINTNAMSKKKIFLRNKRNKRQIDKIRIVASDDVPSSIAKNSDENVYYVSSDDHVFADRAIVREMEAADFETPIISEKNHEIHEDHDDHDDVFNLFDDNQGVPSYINNIFQGKLRHNSLMSKYPHVFMEEISRSKEDNYEDPLDPKSSERKKIIIKTSILTTTTAPTLDSPKMDELIKAISHNNNDVIAPKSNYKVSIKIYPKNFTDLHSGFKEIHTSINKSYNKDGIYYISLVNMSEISKVEKANNTVSAENDDITTMSPTVPSSTVQPILKKEIKEKKEEESLDKLKQHKAKIEQQVKSLRKERQKIDYILREPTETPENAIKKDIIEIVLPFNPPQTVHLKKEDISKLLANAMMKLQEFYSPTSTKAPSTTVTTTTRATPTTPVQCCTPTPTTTTTTTVTPPTIPTTVYIHPPTIVPDYAKLKLLNTMRRNENLTMEILKKIDKNTQLLQVFLQKLIDDHTTTPAPPYIPPIPPQSFSRDLYHPQPGPVPYSYNIRDWKTSYGPTNDPMFSYTLSKLEAAQKAQNATNSHYAIPFVYAYQQPLNLPNKPVNSQVANVVYHGHIHTNAIQNQGKNWNTTSEHDKLVGGGGDFPRNGSKFFLDDLDSHYKIYSKAKSIFQKPIYGMNSTNI